MNTAVEMLATISDSLFLIWFASRFLSVPILKKPYALIVPFAVTCFSLIADFYLSGFSALYTSVFSVLSILYCFLICEKQYAYALMVWGMYMSTISLCASSLYIAFSFIMDSPMFVLQGAGRGTGRIVYLLIAKGILFALLKLFICLFGAKGILNRKNNLTIFWISVCSLFILSVLMNIAVSYDSVAVRLYLVVATAVVVISNVFAYFILNQVQKLLKEKYELKLMQEKIEFERTRAKEVGAMWRKICGVRDDMQGHLRVISENLQKSEIDAAEDYIESLLPKVENVGILIRSGNTVLDYLVNSKLSYLEGVKVQVSGYVGRLEQIEDADIACMLGNIIDNAVEAQEFVDSQKRIELHFLVRNGYFSIVCKNTVKESVLETNKELRSTKKDSHEHGLGHQIVQTVANKYGGFVDYFENDGMFGVQIMLPMRNK